MKWRGARRSGNIENRRRGVGPVMFKGGGGLLVLALVVFALGGDPTSLLLEGLNQSVTGEQRRLGETSEDQEIEFIASVLGNTEDVWKNIMGENYREPTLVVYSGMTHTSCGVGQAAMGPFYCPLDEKLYLDLEFFYALEERLSAPGDFARAYVIAHEVGHHVQTITGTSRRVREAQERSGSEREANALSVRLELQADCYAGVWAHHAQSDYDMLEEGDIEEALNAASQIGDDRLAEQAGGRVSPDTFTHGTSAQRYTWFKKGFDHGRIESCNTF